MKVLVLNSGSSSIKFQVLSMPSAEVLVKGLLERIGTKEALLRLEILGQKKELIPPSFIEDHKAGFHWVSEVLGKEANIAAIDIELVGHRVVHGGDLFNRAEIVDSDIEKAIQDLSALAPLHNPSNLLGIQVAKEVFTKAKQVAVFDTAFFQTLPPVAYTYGISKQATQEDKIRKYGFHGTSHSYVYKQVADFFPTKSEKVITVHLGNGCSISAIRDGKCIDHSLGFTPLSGLLMGTRSGDIDPSVVLFLMEKHGYSPSQMSEILNKESGLLGMTGKSDMRDILELAEAGNKDCQLALDLFVQRVKKYIGSYAVVLGGIDTIAFTAGIGENAPKVREMICQEMEFLGLQIDKVLNNQRKDVAFDLSSKESKVKLLVVPTNEELEIARQAFGIIRA